MSSLSPNLVNLFDCKPQTITWTFDYTYNKDVFSSSKFGNYNFRLHLFKDCEIMFKESYRGDRLNLNVDMYKHYYNEAPSSNFKSRYSVIFLNHLEDKKKVATFTRISGLNAKGEKCDTQEGRVNFDGLDTISGGVYHFNLANFVVSGKLTIFCEVYVLDTQSVSSGFNDDSVLSILNDQKKMLESGKFSDFVISVGGKEFKVHKNILGSRSPVFAAMFEHTDTKEALEGRVEIEDIQSEAFEQFLQYLYTGKASLLGRYAEDLLELAEKYQIDSLKSLCSQQLLSTLTTDSVANLFHLSELYHCDKLNSKCIEFISDLIDDVNLDQWKAITADRPPEFSFNLIKLVASKQKK